jgi:hypothetical protein
MSNGDYDGPDLRSDEIVEALERFGGPQELVALVGFLGESDRREHHRLFVDPALTCWLDIRDTDIVYRRRIRAEQGTYGERSVLLVKRKAVLMKGEVTTADAEAEFLSGGDARGLRCEPYEQAFAGRLLAPPGSNHATNTNWACCK